VNRIRVGITLKMFLSFSLVSLLSLGIIALFSYYQISGNEEQQASRYFADAMERADRSTQSIVTELDRMTSVMISNQDHVIQTLLSPNYPLQLEWFEEKKRIESFLLSLIAYRSYIYQAVVVGMNGKTFQAGGSIVSSQMVHEPAVKQLIGSDRLKFTYLPGTDNLMAGREIRYQGNTIGVVYVTLHKEAVIEAYHSDSLTLGKVYVFDGAGERLYPSDAEAPKITFEMLNEIKDQSEYHRLNVDGYAVQVIRYNLPMTGWTSFGLLEEGVLTVNARKVSNRILWTAGILLVLVLLTSIVLSRQLSASVKSLRDTVIAVKQGRLSERPSIQSGDEIGQLGSGISSMLDKIEELVEEVQRNERQKRNAQFHALQAQIQPHFVYNTLNTIRYLAKLNDAGNIEELTGSFIEMLRSLTKNPGEWVTVAEEIEYSKHYLLIQSYKYTGKLTYRIEAEPNTLTLWMLKLSLQPIVENAILHGIGPKPGGGTLTIRTRLEAGDLLVEVEDNGVGMQEASIPAGSGERTQTAAHVHTGIGLSNIKERIKLAFGEPYGLEFGGESGVSTIVRIRIPQVLNGKEFQYVSGVDGR
jgi:two-component system sensor histidine kinase YesM